MRDEERALSSFANLAAVALERVELIHAMAEAQALAESERLRGALLSSLSHDFRTPLAAILASATTLETYGELSDVARAELLASIRDETEHMTRFVANLLDMTRLEAGALRPRLTTLDLSDIVSDAAARAARQAQAKAVRVVTPDGSAFAVVDPVLLERALINILENAISFSHAGQTITMALTVRGEQAIIAITDEGPGIPADALDLVFEKFYRAGDQAGQRRGVGLGLSIAKGFIEAMHGAIIAANNPSNARGAQFEIAFPLTDAS